MGLGMLFVLNNKASVTRHADDKQDFTLLEQDQPMAEEEEEGVRGGERRKDCNGKDNEKNDGRGPAEDLSIRQQQRLQRYHRRRPRCRVRKKKWQKKKWKEVINISLRNWVKI